MTHSHRLKPEVSKIMKVNSSKRGVGERNAYCCECDWSDHSLTANTKARYHSQKTSHQVDVYTETRSRVKPMKGANSSQD